jgi:2-methylcitrate dehydratase PrpD
MFTADGLGGTESALTHPDGGLLSTYVDGGRPELVTSELGERWELEQISLRRWPAASSLQSLVAVLLEASDSGEVDSIEIALPSTPFAMCAEMGWHDELSAMQSARYVAAVVLRDRRCWIEQFNAARRADSEVTEFATDRVSVVRDDSLPPSGVRVRLTSGGQVSVVRRDRAPGEPDEPLTWEQIHGKLDSACAGTPIAAAGRLDDVTVRVAERPAGAVCADLRAATAAAASEGSDREYVSQR